MLSTDVLTAMVRRDSTDCKVAVGELVAISHLNQAGIL